MQSFLAVAALAAVGLLWGFLGHIYRTFKVLQLGIPGPIVCKLTVWRLRWEGYRGTREAYIESAHRIYGDVVMLAPDEVSVRSAEAVRNVYVTNKLDKPDSAALVLEQFGEKNLVTTNSAALHIPRRKMVSPAYIAPTIVSERSQLMLTTLLGRFSDQLDKQAGSANGVCNIYVLLRYLATDIMTNIVAGPSDALNSIEVPAHRDIVRMVLVPIDQTLASIGVQLMQWYPYTMRKCMRSTFCPAWLKGFADENAGLHGYVQQIVQKRLGERLEEKNERTETPNHIDLLVSRYKISGPDEVIPSAAYIASDALDHLFAGKSPRIPLRTSAVYHLTLLQARSHQQIPCPG
ncbi:hypothetical protein LTS10_008378 [Elasticomyces elasticus]|nr:hypothetical protein LTS10_008378 [Elasticomyces elasticus]